KRRPPGFTPFR
uniref:Wasp kinin PMM1 n=1 Tax=Polistes major TaxID=91420 RepID=BRK_POLMJ|nr:RecName: Full=Wasp kinin PMM1; AltName: Full=Bradykinin-related peptide [Polistes major]